MSFGLAQQNTFLAIDQYTAKSAPRSTTQNLDQLVDHLVKPAKTDREKARSFFSWIAHNIVYDTHYFYNKDTAEPCFSTDCILTQNKTVCLGYARLFQQMCEKEGIPCEVIEGYSREDTAPITKKLQKTDHAWNAVLLDGQWFLVEPTWGSGYLDDQGVFHAEFDDSQFLTDPKAFVKTHLPMDPIWQLLEAPVPVSVFKKGGQAVDEYIARTPPRLDYEKSIFQLLSLPADEARLKSAQRSARFNPDNQFDLAYALMDHAYSISNTEETQGLAIDQQIKIYQQAIGQYRKAIELFRLGDLPEGRPHLDVCLNNLEHLKYLMNELGATVRSR
ncbi:MAG: transglutaminase domain-containing protein [Bacteroidota bacterium]